MSNLWKIVYYHSDKFEKWFKKLGQEKAQALYKNIVLLRNAGNTLNLPYSKSLGQGLFELKEKEFGLRVYYSFLKGKIVVLLHGGDKSTQKMTY